MYTVPEVTFQNEELFISLVTLPTGFCFLESTGRKRPPHCQEDTCSEVSVLCWVCASSVYFHCGVDLPDKHVGCIEANGASEEPEGQDHKGSVAEV